MRTLFTAFILVVVINVFAAVGLIGWLGSSGRLSKARVHAAVDVFRPTITEQAASEEEAAAAQAEQEAVAATALRMEQVAGGPLSPEQVLASVNEVDAYYDQIIKRRDAEVAAIQRQLDATRELVDAQFAELQEQQAAFDALKTKWLETQSDADFQQAVAMLEGVPPRQAKQIMQQLLIDGSEDQVVAYLAAMQERKANNVLKEFKAPDEVAQAARLIEQVRLRSGVALAEAGL
ncbi:MAG: hypothetical protein ACIAXF_15905 [Phycisphaerales bacterium JB063]